MLQITQKFLPPSSSEASVTVYVVGLIFSVKKSVHNPVVAKHRAIRVVCPHYRPYVPRVSLLSNYRTHLMTQVRDKYLKKFIEAQKALQVEVDDAGRKLSELSRQYQGLKHNRWYHKLIDEADSRGQSR